MSEPRPVRRGDVVVAGFPESAGSEIRKRRPWVVVSPDEMNQLGSTFIIAPLTTGHHAFVSRVPCRFAGRTGHVILDQVRTADATRLEKIVGRMQSSSLRTVLERLREMFAE